MPVLLLGASGFLGSWTARALSAVGVETVALVRPESDIWRIAPVREVTIVREPTARWASVVAELRPTAVLSLEWAGVSGADRDAPEQWANLSRFSELVDASIASGVSRFIGVGSQAEYGPRLDTIAESAPLAPITEYGRAKVAAAELLRARAATSEMDWVWGRVFSTFGPLDHPYWLLPRLAAATRRGERVPLTDGEQLWSYLAGADAGAAFATLATADAVSGAYNIGHPMAPRLRDTITSFASLLAAAVEAPLAGSLDFGAIPHAPGAVLRLEPDVTRLSALGWAPQVPLNDRLADTAAWLTGHEVADPFHPGRMLPSDPAPTGRG